MRVGDPSRSELVFNWKLGPGEVRARESFWESSNQRVGATVKMISLSEREQQKSLYCRGSGLAFRGPGGAGRLVRGWWRM